MPKPDKTPAKQSNDIHHQAINGLAKTPVGVLFRSDSGEEFYSETRYTLLGGRTNLVPIYRIPIYRIRKEAMVDHTYLRERTVHWYLLQCATAVSKRLIWLRDTDSCLPLALELQNHLQKALQKIREVPGATDALCKKVISIYERAISKGWVGVGAEPRSTRLGKRTAQEGLLRARQYAIDNQIKFSERARDMQTTCSSGKRDWSELFSLTEQFIDNLDWGEFVIENARGEASNLVLEAIELVEAVEQNKDDHAIEGEVGDVFYNLIACCLSLRIGPTDVSGAA